MTRERGEATKEILERLKRGPAHAKEISDELDIPINTVYYNLRGVLPKLSLIKQLKNGKYAVLGFSPQIEKVKNAHDRMKRKLFRSPKPEEMANLLKKPPAKVRDLLYLHVPGYSEPTAEEIKWSNEKLWKIINMGLDLPDNNTLLEGGIEYIKVYGMDEEILYSNYHRHKKGFDRVEFNRAKAYLIEFPDMAPKIGQEKKENTLVITIDWGELTQIMPDFSNVDPDTGSYLYGPDHFISFGLMKDEGRIDIDASIQEKDRGTGIFRG